MQLLASLSCCRLRQEGRARSRGTQEPLHARGAGALRPPSTASRDEAERAGLRPPGATRRARRRTSAAAGQRLAVPHGRHRERCAKQGAPPGGRARRAADGERGNAASAGRRSADPPPPPKGDGRPVRVRRVTTARASHHSLSSEQVGTTAHPLSWDVRNGNGRLLLIVFEHLASHGFLIVPTRAARRIDSRRLRRRVMRSMDPRRKREDGRRVLCKLDRGSKRSDGSLSGIARPL